MAAYFASYPLESRSKVKYVTIDMWEPYKEIAKLYFPNCIVAVDPFHVVKHLIKGLDDLRLSLQNQCVHDSPRYYLLKKWNRLLNVSNINLDNERKFNSVFKRYLNKRDILNLIFKEFPILEKAYSLKQMYCAINADCPYKDIFGLYDAIIEDFQRSGITEYIEFTNILINWREEIINSYYRPYDGRKLSNAITENINGKIETYIEISHGLCNFPRFRKRVLYALNPDVNYYISQILTTLKNNGKKRGSYNKTKE